MKCAIFAFSRQGCKTARRIMECFLDGECRSYTMERFAETGFLPLEESVYQDAFPWADALIFVGSCGIAVRKIAPYVRDKREDPAVVCIDEVGKFVIPLLSGHIGGANELAWKLAKELKSAPVITTATDINHKFSVDAWAVKHGFQISDMKTAKAVSAAILETDVPLLSDFPINAELPNGVVNGDRGVLGIYLTYQMKKPFTQTLRLIPKVLHLGIGCRRGTGKAAIAEAVESVLMENGIEPRAVLCAASIDLKAEEQGLLEFCSERKLPITFYSAEELQTVEGDFTPSEFVRSVTGVDNVCERAARMGAKELIVKKTARNGVTVAVAMEHLEVHFGETDCCGHWPR